MADTLLKQKAAPKLSKRRPGHWRNLYWAAEWEDGTTGEYLARRAWPSREIAEEKAAEWARENPRYRDIVKYLGAIHFPEDAKD